MKRLQDLLTDKRFLFIILALFVALWTLPITAPGDGRTTFSESAGEAVVAIVLGLLVGTAVLLAIFTLSGADSESKDIARQITSTPMAEALLERWLRRSRFYRLIGGIIAFVTTFLVADSDGGLSQLFFVLLSGVALGGALAEVHVLRRRRGTVAAADLSVRSVRDFTDPTDLAAMAVAASIATAVLVAAALGRRGDSTLWLSLAALVDILAVLAFQFLVARRSRPALRPELREADDLLRFLAATQGFARPAIAAAFFMLAIALGPDGSSSALQLASVGLTILGLVWWYRGRHGRIPQLAKTHMST